MPPKPSSFLLPLMLAATITGCAHSGPSGPVTIHVNVAQNRHAISPLIYGASFATAADIDDLNLPTNRSGGNARTRYNWRQNASNHASDWYFESIPEAGHGPGACEDAFVAATRKHGARPMLTMPTIGWVAKVGPKGEKLAAFSVAKYGAQQKTDAQWMPDAGNGVKPDGSYITGNDPNDANEPESVDEEQAWVKHLVTKWGAANRGGVWCYLMDNEPGIWHETHRDVHPVGATAAEVFDDIRRYGSMVKAADPTALVAGPEEWSYAGAKESGFDKQYNEHHWLGQNPDRNKSGLDYYPWLLQSLNQIQQKTHQRVLDILTIHYYPQGGEFSDDVSIATQLLRNRSTRSLWDPDYVDESWVKDRVRLIPHLNEWVAKYYPGTKVGITEYNWGAEKDANGATAQADIMGILGREGVYLANRWTVPAKSSPVYAAMKLYRNYDGHKATFGDVSVTDTVPDPDTLASYAAQRSSDGALTLVVINKALHAPAQFTLDIAHGPNAATAQVWQVANGAQIQRLADQPVIGSVICGNAPAKSVTLFVIGGNRN